MENIGTAPTQDELIAKLTEEAKEYKKLKPNRFWYSSYYQPTAYGEGFIISKEWLKNWKLYVNYKAIARSEQVKHISFPHPGPIDNESLLRRQNEYYHTSEADDILNTVLKPDVRERFHYTVKPRAVWEFLHKIYGGAEINRKIIKTQMSSYFDFDFQMIDLIVLPAFNQWSTEAITRPKPIYMHKNFTIQQVKERIIKVLNQPEYNMQLKEIRIWRVEPNNNFADLLLNLQKYNIKAKEYIPPTPNEEGSYGVPFLGYSLEYFANKTIEHLSSYYTLTMVAEQAFDSKYIFNKQIKVKLGNCESCRDERPLPVQCKCGEAFYCSEKCLENDKTYHLRTCTYVEEEKMKDYAKTSQSNMGICGLYNLGNTCFMDSGLQCLSHSTPLTYYILNNLYEKDLNPNNPLGSKCMLINTYAKLIKEIWFGANNIIHPSSFKNVLGKVNEIFKGFEQHDSQEFISSVLDIVHEDLNRVKVKPCVEMKTYDSSTLKSGSIESWNGFLLRNQSIIVDFFYGQFISRLKCPKCNVLSYQFDPFSLISVPIPYVLKSEIGFDFIPYDITSKSFSCKVKNNKGDTIADFRKAVGAMLGIDPNSFLIICLDKNSTDMERILGYRHVAKKVCKQYTRRNDRIALVQINPEVWNSADNLGFEKVRGQVLSKFPPIEEKKAEKAKPKFIGEYYYYKKEVIDYRCIEEETDFNNGLDPSIMKVLVHMKTFEKSIYNQFNSRKIEPITPRYIHIKKGSTLAQIHLEVFNLIRPIFNSFIDKNSTTIKIDAFKQLNAVAAIEKIKEELRKPEWEQLLINNGYHEALPYHVRAVSQLERFHSFNACFYCKKAECKGCDIPNDQTALQEFIQSRVMGEFNKYSNNDMFYTENGFTNRLDFEIEINFDEEVLDKIIGGNLKELCNITPYTAKEMEAKKTKSLDECLDSFTVEEQLGEEDTWYCPKCKDHVRAWKKIQINRAPNLLILHLKRFKGTKVYSTNGKIEELVEAPIELDLKKYILDPEDKTTVYQLYGVVNHSGSLGFGHYTANCFNSTRDAWITFNDSSVYQLGNENPISNEAYVLFYKRKDIPFEITNFDLYRKVATPIIVEVTKKEEKKKEESKVPNEEKKEVKLDEPKVMEADGKQKPHANAGVENVKEEEISEHAMNDPTIIKLN